MSLSYLRRGLVIMVGFLAWSADVSAAPVTMGPYNATADSRVVAGYPTTNYGSSTTLITDGSPLTESYIKFSVPSYTGTLVSAKLRLYVKNSSSDGPKVILTSTSWTEG